MSNPYTIRIFVADGDPEGILIIDRMNWTGLGIYFPREKWKIASSRPEFNDVGCYILWGSPEQEEDDASDTPTVYIGEGDGIGERIERHYKEKDFWSSGIAFVSTNRGLNKAHARWLEYALVRRAREAGRCVLDNGNTPKEPGLAEPDKADTRGFFNEICRILPLLNLRAFDVPKEIADTRAPAVGTTASSAGPQTDDVENDTIIVPAKPDGFKRVFLGENCWYAIQIAEKMRSKLRWIAAYQRGPISAVTHIAQVDKIEPYGDGKKYKVVFKAPASPIGPIPLGKDGKGWMQRSRYTSHSPCKYKNPIGPVARPLV
jgi:hypothetical protein